MSRYLVDSCGWIELAIDGPLAARFETYLARPADVVVPTIVQFEVYRWLLRETDEATAAEAPVLDPALHVAPLTTAIAVRAAELARAHGLAMADALVLATGQEVGAQVVTCDRAFERLPGVTYLSRA